MTARNYNLECKDNTHRKYAYHFDRVLRDYIMRTFEPWLPAGKALELGCFRGDMTELIKPHYDDFTVVEAANEMIKVTRDRVGAHIHFIHSTFETVDLPNQYDAIFLIHTLEHLDDPIGTLNSINHWLTDTGRLFLVVPNANAASRQIAVNMDLIHYNHEVTLGEEEHGHRMTYSLDTLADHAKQAGLRIVTRGGIFFKPFANFQFDNMLAQGIIDHTYLEGCYYLGDRYPDLCASIYLICEKG